MYTYFRTGNVQVVERTTAGAVDTAGQFRRTRRGIYGGRGDAAMAARLWRASQNGCALMMLSTLHSLSLCNSIRVSHFCISFAVCYLCLSILSGRHRQETKSYKMGRNSVRSYVHPALTPLWQALGPLWQAFGFLGQARGPLWQALKPLW